METEGNTGELVVIKTENIEIDAINFAYQETKNEYESLQDDNIAVVKDHNQDLSNSCKNCVEFETSELTRPFICGSCGGQYDTICNLHDHIQNHGLGGSYHYDHRSRTAFPKYDGVCTESQTVPSEMLNHVWKSSRRNIPDKTKSILKQIDDPKTTSYQTGQRSALKRKKDNKSVCIAVDSFKVQIPERVNNKPQSDTAGERQVHFLPGVNTESHDDGQQTNVEHRALRRDCTMTSRQRNIIPRVKLKIETKPDAERRTLRRDCTTTSQLGNQTPQVKPKIKTKSTAKGECYGKEIVEDSKANKKIKLSGPKINAILKSSCFKCKLVFSSEEFLQAHMQKHQGNLVCDCCNESFQCLDDLQKHVLDGEGNDLKAVEMFVCSYCHLVVTELKGLLAHLCLSAEDLALNRQKVRTYTGTFTKKKEPCEVIPLTKDDIMDNTELSVQCETCLLWFQNDYFLTMHSVVHRYTYKCSKCNLQFMSEVDRDQHNISCINPASCWICSICGKGFNHKPNLAQHRETHKDTKDLQCEMCGKAFRTKSNLKSHIQRCPELQNREKKFSCEICGKKFFEKFLMKKHINTVHSDVRRFVCEICGAHFKWSLSLRRHLSTHKKHRQKIDCDICGASFKEMEYLERHRKRHGKTCTEQCTYCGKMFFDRWNLKAHIRQHTGEKPFKCDTCGQGFTHNISRKTHMKKCCKT